MTTVLSAFLSYTETLVVIKTVIINRYTLARQDTKFAFSLTVAYIFAIFLARNRGPWRAKWKTRHFKVMPLRRSVSVQRRSEIRFYGEES